MIILITSRYVITRLKFNERKSIIKMENTNCAKVIFL